MVATATTDQYRLMCCCWTTTSPPSPRSTIGSAQRFRHRGAVTHDRPAAQDVTQEVLFDLWRRPQCFHPGEGELRPWLATIAHHRSVDWIRRQQSARGRDRAQLNRALADRVPDADSDVQARMAAEPIWAAVSALPEGERTGIQLAYFPGRSYRQVADDLAAPEGTIKSRIRAGLRHLSLTMYAEAPVES
jgi:RNA polymerase sigma factor (sigma-70 family)